MKRIILLILMILALALTGCSDVGNFTLEPDESEKIVGYCADLLLKYDKNYSANIVDTSMARELAARVEAIKELNRKKEEQESVSKNSGKKKGSSGGEEEAPAERFAVSGEQNIGALLGQQGFDVSYKGMEVASSYAAEGMGDAFTLDASSGHQLMIFHFDVKNSTGEDMEFDSLMSGVSFGLVADGSYAGDAMMTILPNDLSTMAETIPAGGSTDAVVVLEAPQGYGQDVSSWRLRATTPAGESVIGL